MPQLLGQCRGHGPPSLITSSLQPPCCCPPNSQVSVLPKGENPAGQCYPCPPANNWAHKYLKSRSFTKSDCTNSNLIKHSWIKAKGTHDLTLPWNHCLTKIIKATANKISHVIEPETLLWKAMWSQMRTIPGVWLGKVASLTEPHSAQGTQIGLNMLQTQMSKTQLHSKAQYYVSSSKPFHLAPAHQDDDFYAALKNT